MAANPQKPNALLIEFGHTQRECFSKLPVVNDRCMLVCRLTVKGPIRAGEWRSVQPYCVHSLVQ